MRFPLPARTVRLRFTALYGALFLLSGVGLLIISGLVTLNSTQGVSAPAQNQGVDQPSLVAAQQQRIEHLQTELSNVHDNQSRQLLVGSIIALAVMAVLSIVLGRLIAGRVLRPLRTITAATRRISAENLHERLGVPGPSDEVKELADTIDELLGRLEASFAAQRRFVANASHELRTPLTTMRAAVDVAVAKPEPVPRQTVALADRIRAELDQVDRLLDGFLTLARTQHGAAADGAVVSLGTMAAAALDERAGDIAAKSLTVQSDIAAARTRGSRTLLSRMVGNVIDNAVAHNQDGGFIRVETSSGGGSAWLVVETGGRVLDPGQVALLTEPFQRLGADRTFAGGGSGLGLSIVAAVAAAHGGALDLRARPEGGLRVTITLPEKTPPKKTLPENGARP